MSSHRTDGGATVDPADVDAVRSNLEQFAGDAVEEREDGALRVSFGSRTYITVAPGGHVDTGMPLHSFAGPADRLVFDHAAGELHVERDTEGGPVSYTFRRP